MVVYRLRKSVVAVCRCWTARGGVHSLHDLCARIRRKNSWRSKDMYDVIQDKVCVARRVVLSALTNIRCLLFSDDVSRAKANRLVPLFLFLHSFLLLASFSYWRPCPCSFLSIAVTHYHRIQLAGVVEASAVEDHTRAGHNNGEAHEGDGSPRGVHRDEYVHWPQSVSIVWLHLYFARCSQP